jgi:hypothetical protein
MPITVTDLIAVLQTLPPDARVIVQGYENGFNDAAGAEILPVVVNGGHEERLLFGREKHIPADYGGGPHESLSQRREWGLSEDNAVDAVLITSTRTR